MAENSNALPTFDAWIESSKATPVGSVLRSFQKALPKPLLRMTRSLKRGPSLHIPSPRECTTAGVVREKMSFDFQVQQELPAHSIDLFQDHATGSSSQDAVKHSELVSFPYGGDSLESPSASLHATQQRSFNQLRQLRGGEGSRSDPPNPPGDPGCPGTDMHGRPHDSYPQAPDSLPHSSSMHDITLAFRKSESAMRDGSVGCFSSGEGPIVVHHGSSTAVVSPTNAIMVRPGSPTANRGSQVTENKQPQGRWWYDTDYYGASGSFVLPPPP